ncbi:ankyrin repeat domain-containing protein [Hydrogenophaga sp. PAMC20947]|uniref:ankyrin repeat domain-containing protein n=1 Tax=Hydrogenophaga sp. PAMC20947 TaxID=2565558 RepID=UPI00109E1FFF|nr:ankyrin repeat domain-containing protein [Hydrogenophaga sp. PAMC20947]QCB46060.1 hypothetical protein E5678_08545 [Hydrogenophaga sp. PAMC20947]
MNSPTQPPKYQRPNDPLLQRYQEANGHDHARPSPASRKRVLAHARTMVQQHNIPEAASRPAAANDGAWKLRAFGSLAVLGLVGLLVLQFDRGTPEEQATAWGPSSPRLAQPSDDGRSKPAMDAAPALSPDKPIASAPHPDENGQPSRLSDTPAERLAEPQAAPSPTPAPPTPSSPRAAAPLSHLEASPAQAESADRQDSDGAAAPPSDPAQPGRSLDASEAPALNPTPPFPSPAKAKAESTRPPVDQRLKQRSTLQAQSPGSSTVLHTAAMEADAEAVTRALAQGWFVDVPDSAGRTALMLAAEGTSKAVLEQLLTAGASRQARDQQGLNAEDHARLAGRLDWLVLLQP